ncbi:hypothetical protein CH380_20515 [Leptospira adleri]|uniref:Uncharacterized protein n=1 Tax=Leptospira adleri TaxID=2023186 RepID=A0A2M9YIF4_9LEPT|nr:hypothetical protein CH380_20515 [Leptospira adleri]
MGSAVRLSKSRNSLTKVDPTDMTWKILLKSSEKLTRKRGGLLKDTRSVSREKNGNQSRTDS